MVLNYLQLRVNYVLYIYVHCVGLNTQINVNQGR